MRGLVLVAAFVCLLSVGCGSLVEIPPASKGRVLTSGGYQESILPPSRFRLPYAPVTPPKLVIVEASDQAKTETMTVYMPKDKLNLTFSVRGVYSISDDATKLDSIFTRLTPQATSDSAVLAIDFDQIYETYGIQPIKTQALEIISTDDIQTIMENRAAVSQRMKDAIQEALIATPIVVREFNIDELQPPKVIIIAQESAAEREIAIEKAEADKLVALKEAEADLEVAQKQQEIDLVEAETQVLVESKLAEAVSEAFVTQRALKALDSLAKSDNRIILVPSDAFTNPASLIGLNNMIFNEVDQDVEVQVQPEPAPAPTPDKVGD